MVERAKVPFSCGEGELDGNFTSPEITGIAAVTAMVDKWGGHIVSKPQDLLPGGVLLRLAPDSRPLDFLDIFFPNPPSDQSKSLIEGLLRTSNYVVHSWESRMDDPN